MHNKKRLQNTVPYILNYLEQQKFYNSGEIFEIDFWPTRLASCPDISKSNGILQRRKFHSFHISLDQEFHGNDF